MKLNTPIYIHIFYLIAFILLKIMLFICTDFIRALKFLRI